jgi:hypothetical protein
VNRTERIANSRAKSVFVSALALALLGVLCLGVPVAAAEPPAVSIDPFPTTGYTSAQVSGTVNTHGEEATIYAEYATEPTGSFHYVSIQSIPAGASGPTAVSGEVTGLQPGTDYYFRLDADADDVETYSPEPDPAAETLEVVLPTAALEPVGAVTTTTATLSGHIDPNAPSAEATASPEEQQAYNTAWHIQCTPECPGVIGDVAADDTSHEIIGEATGLLPGTKYEVSLVASNAGGEVIAGPQMFQTVAAPPTVGSLAAVETSPTGATLTAKVNPGGAPTSVHFEYLPEASYSAEGGFAGPSTVSTPSVPIGAGAEAQDVSAPVSGLVPGTVYRYRVLAGNTSPGNPVVSSSSGTFVAVSIVSGTSGSCPNEVLRSENGSLALPDCRAYERVTPAFKNGAAFGSESYVGEGPSVEFEAIATFAGTQSASGIGANYEINRSTSGWSTTGLYPPGAQFEGVDFTTPLYALGSDRRSLMGLRPLGAPADEENLYLSQPGSVTEIGSEVPESSLIGPRHEEGLPTDPNFGFFNFQLASRDVSHVIYELFSPGEHDYLWPFDQTGEGFLSSTYEYVGTGNREPLLVGVTGGQGSTALIGGCGTSVGSLNSRDTYNAMSADGSVVFFTPAGEDEGASCSSPVPAPAHTELYARIDGETPAAHTVAISEPTAADCSECNTSAPEASTFQGASEDGSKVFFLTEQELLPGNPGENLYEYDFDAPAGQRVTAVSHLAGGAEAGVQGVARVSEDGSYVYFVADAVFTSEPNSTGASAQSGEDNLYVYDAASGATKFVATLAPADSHVWSSTDAERQVEASSNGNLLLFASVADLTPDDTSDVSQLFRYDASNGELIRVSVGQGVYNDNGNTDSDAVEIPRKFDRYGVGQYAPPQRVMSDDGSYIFFESPNALTPKALDNYEIPGANGHLAENIYEYHDGEVSLISGGRDRTRSGEVGGGASAVKLMGTDPSGEDVLFTTSSVLVPSDQDQDIDIYDARSDGGFPVATQTSCSGEACHGEPEVPPPSQTPGSVTFSGPGDATSSPPAKPATKPLTRAQKLANALRACQRKPKRKRASCDAQARKKYGAKTKRKTRATKSARRSK